MDYFIAILAQFIAAAVVLTFHEFAHAFAAYKCGDSTAKYAGRLTLNPLKFCSQEYRFFLYFSLFFFGHALSSESGDLQGQ